MRATICALMAVLGFSASPGWARNGETGILIVADSSEFVTDSHNHTTLLVCSDDFDQITAHMAYENPTKIYVPGYGVYTVELTGDGTLSVQTYVLAADAEHCQ